MASVFTLEGVRFQHWWQRLKNRRAANSNLRAAAEGTSMINMSTVGPEGAYGASLVGHLGRPYPAGMSLMGPGLGFAGGGLMSFALAIASGAALGAGGLWAYRKATKKNGFAGLFGAKPRRRRRRSR